MSKITILGAGGVGLVLALFLRKQGHNVTLYDGRHDPRSPRGDAYRSISITLSDRGLRVLERLGLADKARMLGMRLPGRIIHSPSGPSYTQHYGKSGEVLHCMLRAELDRLLLKAIDRMGGIDVHFAATCESIDLQSGTVQITDAGSERFTLTPDCLVGADGPGSLVRRTLEQAGRLHSEIIEFESTYREVYLDPNSDGPIDLDPRYLHLWPRPSCLFAAFPDRDGGFAGMLFLSKQIQSSLSGADGARELFDRELADLIEHVPEMGTRLAQARANVLRRVRCHPWIAAGRFALIGDAAHTILPFYGQGMNASLEDCQVFADCLEQHHGDLPAGLLAYQQQRKSNADAIDELSLGHFHYLSGFSVTAESIQRKEIEADLVERYPHEFASIDNLVEFSEVPYRLCHQLGQVQSALVETLLSSGEGEGSARAIEVARAEARRLRASQPQ
jgi:kynurenine 3-monooxygenase